MQNLNLNHLYYFYTIAREGSIRDACKKLSLTQSTLSNQLKELELFLGGHLFERKSKGLSLNETGKKVLNYATEIFKLRDELTLSVKNHSIEAGKIVRIGFVPCFMKKDVCRFFRGLWNQKQTLIKSKQDCLSNLLDELASKTIDVILSDRPILHQSLKLKNRELFKKPLVFVGHKKFSHLTANFPHSLNGIPFCAYSDGSNTQVALEKFFKTNNITPNIIGEFDDAGLLQLFAEDGQGIVAIPADVAKKAIANEQLCHLGTSPDLHVSTWVINLFDDKIDNYLRKCIDEIDEQQIVVD